MGSFASSSSLLTCSLEAGACRWRTGLPAKKLPGVCSWCSERGVKSSTVGDVVMVVSDMFAVRSLQRMMCFGQVVECAAVGSHCGTSKRSGHILELPQHVIVRMQLTSELSYQSARCHLTRLARQVYLPMALNKLELHNTGHRLWRHSQKLIADFMS